MQPSWSQLGALALLCLVPGRVGGAEVAPDSARRLEQEIRPLLEQKCFDCHSHSASKLKGGLMLDSHAGMLQGGDSGQPAVVPNQPEKSPLLARLRSTDKDEQMPPKGERLTPQEMTLLEEWVRQGAPWPETSVALKSRPRGKITDEDRAWWAFQPPKPVKVPQVRDADWTRTDIDRFVVAKLAASQLEPSPEASRPMLIRRLYFDVWGLPPSAQEIDEFVADDQSNAYERLVDRLLASPHYGERWARHWLDLVRYADSDGYKADDLRPNAWRYRDYVIRSLNADKPYDRFVREQLAGDELYPEDPDARIATGYLRNGIYEYNNRDVRGQWTTLLDDITDTTGDVFFGLGFQCARCHDHKFDPILQKDYFRLQAFFAGIQLHDDLPVAPARQQAEYALLLADWEQKTAAIRQEIETLEAPYKAKVGESALAKFPPDIQVILRKPEADRSPLERQLGALAYRQISYEHDRIAAGLKPADKEAVADLRKKLDELKDAHPAPLPTTLTVAEVGPSAPPTFIPKRPDEVIDPGFPSVFEEAPTEIRPLPQAPESTGRRAALANWLTQPDNPLTARVIVNRVWQYHFGRGLVTTSSDFGQLGEPPSHPDLLDWLTQQFVADGWSLKKLHRLILTSATYRQASTVEVTNDKLRGTQTAKRVAANWERAQSIDPENRLLWRGQTRRLEAEQIRDALLTATGELKPEPIGPAADASQFYRSIYSKVLRNTRDPLLDVFDAPQQFTSTPSRDTTTTPVQSLLLINSQFMLQRAQTMAIRLDQESAGDSKKAVELAYLATFGRRPDPAEALAADQFLIAQKCVVDPELALSASAGFLSERIPFREGRAALLTPKSRQQSLPVSLLSSPPESDFTIEAFVYLRSVAEDDSIRAIASCVGGTNDTTGWVFGATGRKSSGRPQTLVLKLTGNSAAGQAVNDEVSSDLTIHSDKPYYVGATVRVPSGNGLHVTFYVKDLSNDEEPLLVTQARTEVSWAQSTRPLLTLGGRPGGKDLWDGMLDDVRFTAGVLSPDELYLNREGTSERTLGLWQFEPKPSYFHDASGLGNDLQPAKVSAGVRLDARALALADFCHALLNANEFLYVE